MDLWHGSLSEFVRLASADAMAARMSGPFVAAHGRAPGDSELQSWRNSLAAVAHTLAPLESHPVAVGVRERPAGDSPYAAAAAAAANAASSGPAPAPAPHAAPRPPSLCTEYHLPYSHSRIDLLLFGRSRAAQPTALVVELKQWSRVDLRDEFNENVVVAGIEHPHPSQQAQDYRDWLANYHSAFIDARVAARACSYLHNMPAASALPLRDARFDSLLAASPMFLADDASTLAHHVRESVGFGDGAGTLDAVIGGSFQASPTVLEALESVLQSDRQWHLLGPQRVAYNTILAEVRRAQRKKGQSVILVRGGPGTGKTVIAVQALADVGRMGLKALHSTGGKAFTTALRSKFKGADKLFAWNMNLRKAASGALDLLVVDEAHRVRDTSDTRFTPAADRGKRKQVDELIDAAKVTVFLLDENQFVRPDEIGTSALIESAARQRGLVARTYDLAAQFRCGGCVEYVSWVDGLLGFSEQVSASWGDRYRCTLAESTADLDELIDASREGHERARILAGFCWKWSDPDATGALVNDVNIGDWHRPWNAKAPENKSFPPSRHPYTLWAETEVGLGQVGCIYSAQGFEFDRVGVIWGEDLVWRTDRWVAQKQHSHDRPVKGSKEMLRLVRNAYRVLLTRGIREMRLLVLDAETRAHISSRLSATVV